MSVMNYISMIQRVRDAKWLKKAVFVLEVEPRKLVVGAATLIRRFSRRFYQGASAKIDQVFGREIAADAVSTSALFLAFAAVVVLASLGWDTAHTTVNRDTGEDAIVGSVPGPQPATIATRMDYASPPVSSFSDRQTIGAKSPSLVAGLVVSAADYLASATLPTLDIKSLNQELKSAADRSAPLLRGEGELKALSENLCGQLERTEIASEKLASLVPAISSVAARLQEGGEEANALAADLSRQLARSDIDYTTRRALGSAFSSVAGRLDDGQEADGLARFLQAQLTRTGIDFGTRRELTAAFGSVAGRLQQGGEEANTLAKDLGGQLARKDIDFATRRELAAAFHSVAGRLRQGSDEVNYLARDLGNQIARTDIDFGTRQTLAAAFGSVAVRLDDDEGHEASAIASDLRRQLARTDIDFGTRRTLTAAFSSVLGRLKQGGSEADAIGKGLWSQLAKAEVESLPEETATYTVPVQGRQWRSTRRPAHFLNISRSERPELKFISKRSRRMRHML